MSIPYEKVEKVIGYQFKDRHLLERALTHSSTGDEYNYQRLEFLGDRVVGLVIADALFKKFRSENEGGLAKRHTALIQGSTLAIIGQAHGLNDFIQFSEAEKSAGGSQNENIIADVVESLLGAIFIDGGYDLVQEVILRLWGDNIETLKQAPQDPKTELQEWAQARQLPLPVYEIISKSGPDHAPVFTIQLSVEGFDSITDEGPSRRQTEKTAARKMLKKLKSEKAGS
ncbi:MAG: ribonuclease III [Alphaproteobacteria bacterium]|nr:ribonuclease III [Alphaproteobacteria bacterium]